MKKLYGLLLLVFFSLTAHAQPYGNEWIPFSIASPVSSQQYLKIQVWQEGIHRITVNDIDPFISITNTNPAYFQIFHKGVEQYIYVYDASNNNVFDGTDYIEFYGKPNDGSLDTQLYDSAEFQLNPFYSLFNDTAAYFFTINANQSVQNKRMIIDIDSNFPLYPQADFVIKDVWNEYHVDYSNAADYSVFQNNEPSYTSGEGFSGLFFYVAPQTLILSTPNPSNNSLAPLPRAITAFLGKNNDGNQRNWTINVNGTTQAFSFYGYKLNHFDFTLPVNSLAPGSATFLFSTNDTWAEFNSIPYIRVIYPHTLNFNNEPGYFQKFTVKGDLTANKTRLEISNFNPSNTSKRWLYVFSGDTIRKVNVDSGAFYKTLVPTFYGDRQCLLTTESASLTGGHLVAPVSTDPGHYAQFTNFMYNTYNPSSYPEYDYLMISHKSLMPGTSNPVIDYKNYRQSAAGGGYKVLLADIDELYDQFSYGIIKSPLSIRNFCKFALDTFSVHPDSTRYLFLVGKSIRDELSRLYGGGNYSLNMVPTYGDPPSDMMLTSRYLPDTVFRPAFATGRLPARTPQDVTLYLNKVLEHDQLVTQSYLDPQPWMKQILHFGGGHGGWEADLIKTYLKEYEDIIEDTLYAGNVTSFFRTTTDPIEANQSDFLKHLIDSGVTIMTFFAHAAGSTFDITTDNPNTYGNKGRYPIIIANSCYIGDIHVGAFQASEQFVLIPDKGAIGFIASPNIGYIFEQPEYTKPLYRNFASYDYGKTIGKCMKDAIDSTQNLQYTYRKSITMGMTLNGDPALKLYNFGKPDLEVAKPRVYFTPSYVTTELDSFKITVIVRNLGRAIDQDYHLQVTRKYPDGGTKLFDTIIHNMHFLDTITINVAMDFALASGLNTFDVFADAVFPFVNESNEGNNFISVGLLILSSDINPVYPFKYAIVPNNDVTVKASTSNLFAPMATYRFEIDTVDRFNSNFKKTADISSVGGLVEWHLPFPLVPDRVYYWRVANAAILNDPVNYHWKESSFIHKPGKTGWSQAHYSQFKEDEFRNIIYADSMPPQDTTFKFVNIASSIICHNTLIDGHTVDYYINNILHASNGCSYHQINLAILDSITLDSWKTDVTLHDLGNKNKFDPVTQTCPLALSCCSGYAPSYFLYPSDSASLTAYADSLASAFDSVPIGNYILIYTIGGGNYSHWNANLNTHFDNLAPGQVPFANNYQPFIYFTKKGSNMATILYGDTMNNKDFKLDTIIGGNWDKGFITSVKIGPATHWSELHWGQHSFEPSDSIDVSVIGINAQDMETTLIANLPISVSDSVLSGIDANVYPYLKLQSYHEDKATRTPPQLDRWQIYYDEVPEAALAPNKWFKPNPFTDTIDEGGIINLEMAVANISSHSMDSMLVDFFVYDKNHVRTNISSPRYDSLRVGQWIKATASFNTKNFAGLNSLWIEANPHNDQVEQYHFNNIAELVLDVNRDITNPILDVTFDGQHILDGDIVSAKPFIFIKVKDENKFVAMNDTAKFPVRITDPQGKVSRIYFEKVPNASTDRALLKWTPAVLDDGSKPDNSFKIEYNPVFDVDGVYQLEVQGSDAAGNLSGAYAYRISFEVINRSTITDFINYPNPFSTATKFVFTLTGSEIPTYLKIQIMTVSGKIVREITQSEIGNIHVGRNITEYAWDGKDEFGDKLANGIYLYRVITRLNGESIEHRQTEADHFFKKGWGKMCLIR